jgi:DNA repair exonuclease SbcCD nuclease subunit
MKFAVIADTHFGVRKDEKAFLDNQERFFSEFFFPTLDDQKIDTLVHAGDLFDNRKSINMNTLDRTKAMFLDPLLERGIKMHIIPGNHDVYYKNTNRINALTQLLHQERYTNTKIHEECSTIDFDGLEIALIPWITPENEADTMKFISATTAPMVCGHFEFIGHEMYAGTKALEGLSTDAFKRFTDVWSGHYHHRSTKGNIHYLGASSEYIWTDAEDERGFNIFDTETKALEYYRNPFPMFQRIHYLDNSKDAIRYINDFDTSSVASKIVRVIVSVKNHSALFDRFVERLHEAGPLELTIAEDFSRYHESRVYTESEVLKLSPMKFIETYVDEIDDDQLDKEKLKIHMSKLYIEADHGRTDG